MSLSVDAVGYGSFDFQRPTSGVVCCYTLKNPAAAEVTFTTPAGAAKARGRMSGSASPCVWSGGGLAFVAAAWHCGM